MTIHLFRPADDTKAPTPPVGAPCGRWLAVAVPQLLARLWALCHRPGARQALHICLIVLGLVVQGLLLLTVAYLCDLALALMELWADLARKHLEITM